MGLMVMATIIYKDVDMSVTDINEVIENQTEFTVNDWCFRQGGHLCVFPFGLVTVREMVNLGSLLNCPVESIRLK